MRGRHRRFVILNDTFAARDNGDVRLPGEVAGAVLVTEHFHGFGTGADEIDLTAAAHLVEVGVLRQKTVARMDRFDVAHFGGANDAVDFEVALRGLGRPHADRLVGQFEIRAAPVRFAKDSHRLNTHLATGTDDPQSDLSTIGNQDTLVHESV